MILVLLSYSRMTDMDTNNKSKFDLSAQELEQKLSQKTDLVNKEALDQGLYISYRDHHCVNPDQFVHEYKDGRKELIRINSQTGKEEFLKNL
jgi:hypothetical protein